MMTVEAAVLAKVAEQVRKFDSRHPIRQAGEGYGHAFARRSEVALCGWTPGDTTHLNHDALCTKCVAALEAQRAAIQTEAVRTYWLVHRGGGGEG